MSDKSVETSQGSLHGSQGAPLFLVGTCPSCQREVLTARDLAEVGLVDVCLHCGHCFERAALRLTSPREVTKLGYDIDGLDGDEECDSHGGCRDGTCGVQQPER